MGRRSDHTQDELKKLIINASIDLIRTGGIAAFGTRAIAREIGYSFGTIYHLYGDLETLRFHVKARILELWYEELHQGMTRNVDKARYLVDAYIGLMETQQFLWAFVFAPTSTTKDDAPDWYINKVQQLFSLATEALIPITRDIQSAELAAHAIWPSIHGICVLSMSRKLELVSEKSPKALARHLLEIYMKGLKIQEREQEQILFTSTRASND